MDALLAQLRQQMHELSQQGDGVTLQMWKLYNLLEDFAAHVYKTNMMEWPEIQADRFMGLLQPSNKDKFDVVPSKETVFKGCTLEGCTGECLHCESNPVEYSIQKSEPQGCRANNTSLDTTLTGINSSCKDNCRVELTSKDYVAYSGSTSADSGYKSCESTVSEMSNVSYYDSKLHFDEVEGKTFKTSFSKQSSPKIRMGTKAVIWQTKKPVHSQSFSKTSTCKKTDNRFYDTRLDHLMYLRASVMNVLKDRKSDAGSKLSGDNLEPAKSGSEICSGIENNPKLSLQLLFDSQTIRTNNETPLLEKEIDELLYGKAEYYDLESVENFPCSYVTMIEEKYKRGRKCKDYHKTHFKKMPTFSEKGSVIENSKSNKDITGIHILEHDSKLSEVARSMLEIIQDLSQQGMTEAQHTSNISIDNALNNLSFLPSALKNSSLPASEYHIYEEIPNDYNSNKMEKSLFPVPPPLPKRHPSMFHTSLGLSNSVENTLNKPKRRDNLYSLFSDQCSRRCLSASLAEEWKEHEKEQFLDEYGFRRDNI